MQKSIKLKTTYPHPIEKVWAALTDAQAMSQWLMPCDIKAEVGYHFQFRTKPYPGFDGLVHCEVLEVIPQEKLVFSWTGGGLQNTKVSFHLRPDGEQTVLHFEHSGFAGLLNRLIARNILARGWKRKILTVQLPEYLRNPQIV